VLDAHGYTSIYPALPSANTSPPTVTLYDDAKLIRSEVGNLVEEGKDVVVVMHSYGGIVGSEAIAEELGRSNASSRA